MSDPSRSGLELYRWKRHSPEKPYKSKLQKPTGINDGDIKSWIKKVEDASDYAAAVTFGHKPKRKPERNYLEETQEAAKAEAEALLGDWANEKLRFENEADVEDAIWAEDASADDKGETGEDDSEYTFDRLVGDINGDTVEYSDFDVEKYESEDLVKKFLDEIRAKEVVRPSYVKDVSYEKKAKNPVVTMEMRQQQVKQNREKQKDKLEHQRRERQIQKELERKATQKVLKEQREKESQEKREELEIQQEMARVRKELQEEKKRTEDFKKRQKQAQMLQRAKEQIEKENDLMEQAQHVVTEKRTEEVRQRELDRRRREYDAKYAAKHLQLMQTCFSAWLEQTVNRRLQLRKVSAVWDWKVTVKAWRAWRAYVREVVSNREQARYENVVKDDYRKKVMGESHHTHKTLRKCFAAWATHVALEKGKKAEEERNFTTHRKMAAFLEAVSSSKASQEDLMISDQRQISARSARPSSAKTSRRVDDFFAANDQVVRNPKDKGQRSTKSRPHAVDPPREAWQVTRAHLPKHKVRKDDPDLTDQFSLHEGTGDGSRVNPASESDRRKRSSGDTEVSCDQSQKPTDVHYEERYEESHSGGSVGVEGKKVPRGFHNRYSAQQKILSEQQKMLKEQQREIADLKYRQERQLMEESVARQTGIQEQLERLHALALQGIVGKQRNPNQLECQREMEGKSSAEHQERDKTNTPRNGAETARTNTTSVAGSAPSAVSSKHTAFVRSMGDRSAERARMKAERMARQRQQEEERLAKLQEEGDALRLQEEEQKRQRVAALKEKRRIEKQKEADKAELARKANASTILAVEHHRKYLMRYRGLGPFKRLVQMAKEKEQRAREHWEITCLRNNFCAWREYVKDEIAAKSLAAHQLHCDHLVRRMFSNWTKCKVYTDIQIEKAERHHTTSLKQRFLLAWLDISTTEKVARWERERAAGKHNLMRLKKTTFALWKKLPQAVRREKEKNETLARMRKTISTLLPDFQGVRGSTDSVDTNA